MFAAIIIIFSTIILLGLTLALLGWQKRRVVDPWNPVPSWPKLLTIGLALIVIGLVGLGIFFLKRQVFLPPVEKPPEVKRPEPFSVIATNPQNGATVARNAVVQVFFNRAVRPTDALRLRVVAIQEQDAGEPVPMPSSVYAANEPLGSTVPTSGSFILNPLESCGEKFKNQPCFAANKKYRVELDAGNIRDFKDTETLSCSSSRPCSFEFTTNDKIDTKAPAITMPLTLDLPVSERAAIDFKTADESGISYIRMAIDPRQSAPRPLGVFPGPFEDKISLTINTSGFIIPSRHFLTIEAYDAAGNHAEATSVITFYENHCFNKEQDSGETGPDCGGRDCAICQEKKEEKLR